MDNFVKTALQMVLVVVQWGQSGWRPTAKGKLNMKFKDFEQIVLQKYPTAKVSKHGEFSGSKINVGIAFNEYGKVYQYTGTYCYVLNKLGIKAIYSHDVWNIEQALARCKELHGTVGLFGDINDCTEEIQDYEKQLQDIYSNYVVVR